MTTRVDWNEQIRANAEKRHEKNKNLWKKASNISDDTIKKVEKERKLKGLKESYDRRAKRWGNEVKWKKEDVVKAKKHLSEAQNKKNILGFSAPDKKGIEWSKKKIIDEEDKLGKYEKRLKEHRDDALRAKTLQIMQREKSAGRRRRRKRTKKKRRKTRRSKKKRRKRRRTKKKRRRRR